MLLERRCGKGESSIVVIAEPRRGLRQIERGRMESLRGILCCAVLRRRREGLTENGREEVGRCSDGSRRVRIVESGIQRRRVMRMIVRFGGVSVR